ncbi:MAG: glycine cleavage T C-terminal barrel domain-containing protein, partial [Acidimicrobiia bacterium]
RLATVDEGLAGVARFDVRPVDWNGVPCVVAGTGYTGEDGVEIQVPAAAAGDLWAALLAAGITPAGLGARDTLRLEAGLPLHGHELGPGITPLQAGLAWVVRFDKGEFRGREPLERERASGPARRLVGLSVQGRQPPRAGAAVLAGEQRAGTVTSGNFSPTLERAIALAFLPPEIEEGAPLAVEMRGTAVPATVVKPPFVKR